MNIRTLYASEIECRIGMVNEKGLSLLLYKNARVDMQILDECFGVFGWKRNHTCIDRKLYCTIQIKDPDTGQWISKEDVGVSGFTEKEKSQASDSFKRAAVNIGIGRELYSAPFIWVPATKVTIQRRGDKFCCYDHFKVSSISYNDKKEITGLSIVRIEDNSVVYELRSTGKNTDNNKNTVLSDGEIKELYAELGRTGVDINSVFKRYGISTIEEMSHDTFNKALNSLRKTKDKIKVA
ncbi:MAG: hypothetical protein MSH11_01895 [Ruminococcus sp.]|nr:hypothetical protein [Ruminococcus sp.]